MPGFGTSSFYRQGPYQIRPTGTSYVATTSATPPPPGAGMGPAAPRQTNFQTSLNRERARDAMGEASYAAMAPLPKVNGVYKGAYGEGPQAEQQAMAARNAFVQKKRDIANFQNLGPDLGGANYYRKQEVEDQQLGNATTLANAQAGLAQATGDAAVGTADAKMKAAENLDPAVQLKDLTARHNDLLKQFKDLQTRLSKYESVDQRNAGQQQMLKQRQDYDQPLRDAKIKTEQERQGMYKNKANILAPGGATTPPPDFRSQPDIRSQGGTPKNLAPLYGDE